MTLTFGLEVGCQKVTLGVHLFIQDKRLQNTQDMQKTGAWTFRVRMPKLERTINEREFRAKAFVPLSFGVCVVRFTTSGGA